jgi:hypothetical protein
MQEIINMIALTNMAKVFFITVLIITGIVLFLFLTLFIAHNYRKTGIFRTEFNGIDFDFDKERKDFMSKNKLYFFLGKSVNHIRVFIAPLMFIICLTMFIYEVLKY